jgi:uncharacterized protein
MTAPSPGSTIEIRPGFLAHRSGALWLADSRTLLLADVHLGYGWAQRRRGELGPLRDAETRTKLLNVTEELGPTTIVFLGDLVHAPDPAVEERRLIETTLSELAAAARLIAVLGNHDRRFLLDFPNAPVETASRWRTPCGWFALHGDCVAEPPGFPLILGHLHPAIAFADAAGASQRLPVFLYNNQAVVLPAFSPFAAGYVINRGLPGEWEAFLGAGPLHLIAATGQRAATVGQWERPRFRTP